MNACESPFIDIVQIVIIVNAGSTEFVKLEVQMDLFTTDLNYWAVLVAAAIAMIVGSLWYSPLLFAQPWLRLLGKTMEQLTEEGHGSVVAMTAAVIGSLITAYVTGACHQRVIRLARAGRRHCGGGIALGGASLGVQNLLGFLFSARPIRLWLLDGGNQLVTFVLMGLVIGLWR